MVGRRILRVASVLVLLSFFVSCRDTSVHETKKTYRIGYMICNSEQETRDRFKPLTAYLSKKLGVSFEAVAIDTVDFTKHVSELDFTHSNSLLYVIMHRNYGVEILAAEKAGSLGARAKGIIITLKKSGIKNIHDLKGKTMVFGPMLGPTSYMSQLDILLRNGIDPDNDLASYAFPSGSFKHEKVIYGVFDGAYIAGAAPLLDFERMIKEDKVDKNDFIVLAEGQPIPYCNFGVGQRVDVTLAKRFKDALLALDKDETVEIEGEVVKVLARADVDGYEDIKDNDFDGLREMAKRTNMPPYQKF